MQKQVQQQQQQKQRRGEGRLLEVHGRGKKFPCISSLMRRDANNKQQLLKGCASKNKKLAKINKYQKESGDGDARRENTL